MSEIPLDFEIIDKGLWLQKIVRELKGRPYEELLWHVNERITIDPLLAKPEQSAYNVDLPDQWFFGEEIEVKNAESANTDILEVLNQGIQAPYLHIHEDIDLQRLFQNIELDYIHLSLSASNAKAEAHVLQYLKSVESPNAALLSSSIDTAKNNTRVRWKITESDTYSDQDADRSLSELYYSLTNALNDLNLSEMTPLLKNMVIDIHVGSSFYLAIAKLRAVRILFDQYLQTIGIDEKLSPRIMASFNTTNWTDDPNKNLITSTTQCLSSVLGGADIVHIAPADISEGSDKKRYRRISRNIHQILALESQIQQWHDPVKGSYFLETLSYRIAQSAWQLLQKKVADEG